MPTNQLSNLTNYARQKNNPEIFSVYDFNQWCINHKYDENSIHSTFVPYYYINDINDIFVLFTTKQLLKDTQFTYLLQVEKKSFLATSNDDARFLQIKEKVLAHILLTTNPGKYNTYNLVVQHRN
ncbi:unnamed protein product [Rotaria magnacalcarata]|uniref:Uncharacterized protein n=1 Tax=Rotaria magnacalcarata TaxID=392030 RepID=A0A816PCE2_9BILA|nr:unnamed protein product [Rotaria magnacalcarata]